MKMSSSPPSLTSTFAQPMQSPGRIRSYIELQQQIHDDLRVQHPEWVEPNGDSPICDHYERRLAELIHFFQSAEDNLVAA
jgi:hypothetical protein